VPQLRKAALAALLGLLLAAPPALAAQDLASAPSVPPTAAPAFVPGGVIVQLAPDAGRTDRVAARADAEVSFVAVLGDPGFQLVEVLAGQPTGTAIASLRADPAVTVAERDSYSAPASIPDDPLFGQEWGLQNLGTGVGGFSGAVAGADIDASAAWEKTVGVPTTVVADIDSGYRFDSPDLGPVAWVNPDEVPGDEIDNDGNGLVDDVHGYDFVGASAESPSQDSDPTDDDLVSGGHGVHTAGTIGAAGDNGIGITGVAQDARIMPLRVCANLPSLSESRCPVSAIIAAINYAGANGARVANMSLTGSVESSAELNALAENPETLFVAAAGNDGQDNDSAPRYPCNFEPGATPTPGAVENVVCVAATDQADQLAGFSDWGSDSVDLGAPGTEILSTYPASESFVSDDFELDDFATRWTPTSINGGFARTNEAPLTSFGISDSPGGAPTAESGRSSTLSSAVAVPAGYGACRFSGRDSISLGGGTATLIVFKNGVSAFTFQLPETSGSQMASFTTAAMTGLAGSNVGVRVRYVAGSAPTAASGVWLDDLDLSCKASLGTPPSYAFLQGTSMAAPQVSGTAALLFSLRPGASVAEAREALLDGVDPTASLVGRTTTGGRLDAALALAALDSPTPPSLDSTDPGSPANDNQPRIVGSAEPGTTVDLYADATCDGPVVASGSAAELSSPGIAVSVADNSEIAFSAEARIDGLGASGCSQPISYTEVSPDGPAPAAPVLLSTSPTSPASFWFPRIVGSAEPGSSIRIFVGTGCAGATAGTGTAAELSSSGIEVSVRAESTAQFSATATDADGNTSTCSAPISYTNTATIGASSVIVTPPPPLSPPALTPPEIQAPCTVPRLVGRTQARAQAALGTAGCALGRISKPKRRKGLKSVSLVVKSSSPAAGSLSSGPVDLTLGPKPKKPRH
jgi:subtilisin family serine protease